MFDAPHIPEKYLKDFLVKIPMVRLGVLHMLSKKAMCGNKIATEMQHSPPGFPAKKLNPNVLYPLLHNLEEEGFIKGEWEDEKKRTRRFYNITPKGKTMLKSLKTKLKPVIKEGLVMMRKLTKELFGEEL